MIQTSSYIKNYHFPETVDNIKIFDIYIEKDIETGVWSLPKVVRKLCNSQKEIFRQLINRKGIQIKVKNDF